ncbi:MAG: Trk system potassium transporter TrkA [Bacteroidales bacterium]|nr:Trk system potassium transporter TrkA [Bacteroidales bacterium]
MKIIIAGAGEVGSHLAKMLSNENQDIIVIDSDQDKLDILDSHYNLMTLKGSTSSFDAMRTAGINGADLYIAVTPYETRNIASCAIAKKLGVKKTVARIDNYEFMKPENRKIFKELGIDTLIYPEHVASQAIDLSLSHNWARYWAELGDGQLNLIGVKIRNNSKLCGVKIKDMPVSAHHFHVSAIKRNAETVIPGGNDTIEDNDIVYFITTPEYVEEVRELCGKRSKEIKKVMIMGGSQIALRFCLDYQDKYNILIIDINRDRCEFLAAELPDVEVVNGDGRDVEVLRENNVYQYDAFVALTNQSETNILSCLTAKDFGVVKTIADVENLQFYSLAENLNIGHSINKKLMASSSIFQILLDSDESNSKFLALTDAEVCELEVRDKAKITKSPVKDLHLPWGMTLAALIRNGHAELIGGMTHIKPGDHVVVFCLTGTISKIEKWFN